jgi:hypothetical protein
MAASKRTATRHEDARRKIQTARLVERLSRHVLGEIELSPSQVSAGLGLLKKTLPELTGAQVTGANGAVLAITVTLVKPDAGQRKR